MKRNTGQQWKRVSGDNLNLGSAVRKLKHDGILASGKFKAACEAVGVKPTRRQVI